MAPKVGGTPPGGKHDYAIPFRSVGHLLTTYKNREADKLALFDLTQSKGITFGELHKWANKVANWLVGKGIQKGDRIALLGEESLEKLLQLFKNFKNIQYDKGQTKHCSIIIPNNIY